MYKCKHCNETFENNFLLSNHIRWKHKEQLTYVCDKCNKEFKGSAAFKNHIGFCKGIIVKIDKTRMCSKCGSVIKQHFKKHYESCTGTGTQKENRKKYKCKFCGISIHKNFSGCCNKCCRNKLKDEYYNKIIRLWKENKFDGMSGLNGLSSQIRRYIFEKFNNRCSICGWNKINPRTKKIPLEVEHIDGNYKNNKEENLTLLCPNCHSLTPTFGGLNRGNGRHYRRERYKEGKSF
jgi:hypothetical protein